MQNTVRNLPQFLAVLLVVLLPTLCFGKKHQDETLSTGSTGPATAAQMAKCPTWAGPWKGKLGKLDERVKLHCMSDAEIEQLIALGKKYKTLDKLWDAEFRGNQNSLDAQGHPNGNGDEFQLSTWSTATKLRILTDSWKIASGSFQSAHELRSFSVADARTMANGVFAVTVLSADTGHKQNATRNVHVVLDLEGEILQPESKAESNLTLSKHVGLWYVAKNSTMTGNFTFILPNQHAPTGRLVIIGNSGKQHFQVIDFSRLR